MVTYNMGVKCKSCDFRFILEYEKNYVFTIDGNKYLVTCPNPRCPSPINEYEKDEPDGWQSD